MRILAAEGGAATAAVPRSNREARRVARSTGPGGGVDGPGSGFDSRSSDVRLETVD